MGGKYLATVVEMCCSFDFDIRSCDCNGRLYQGTVVERLFDGHHDEIIWDDVHSRTIFRRQQTVHVSAKRNAMICLNYLQ